MRKTGRRKERRDNSAIAKTGVIIFKGSGINYINLIE